MRLVTVLLPQIYIDGLDDLCRKDLYQSRSAVIREAVRELLKKEHKIP